MAAAVEPGALCLVLHAHLPFVRHPEHEFFLEEDWLFEAISETYIPLLDLCERLLNDRIPFQITLTITPTLAAMLEDELLRERYLRHVSRLCDLSELEVFRTKWLPELHPLALRYSGIFRHCRDTVTRKYPDGLLPAFRSLQETGAVEIITCGATHGFLPLMLGRRNLWRAQIQTAVHEHERHFGRPPRGIWLPECGFEPGIDSLLRESGLRFFFTDAHGILNATPRPRFGIHAPLLTPSGVAAFGRDVESARQVWCARLGYPGDVRYREFYRDAGWDLEYEYLRPFLHPDGNRTNLGIKYHRITGPTADKEPYDFESARGRAAEHARHFLSCRIEQVEALRALYGRAPVISAPYDAELFGHWWYEGPQWLEFLLRGAAAAGTLVTMHPAAYLERHPRHQVAMPSYSSWGLRGYAEHWLDRSNDWLYPHLHMAGERMIELANRYRRAERSASDEDGLGLLPRALRQAARELLLAQSSDWAFILKAGTMTSYAEQRSREHLSNFNTLYEGIRRGRLDPNRLARIESKNNLFPEIDYSLFADPE